MNFCPAGRKKVAVSGGSTVVANSDTANTTFKGNREPIQFVFVCFAVFVTDCCQSSLTAGVAEARLFN